MALTEVLKEASLEKEHLIGIPRHELHDVLRLMGAPSFRAKQIWHWIYYQGVQDFDQMLNISKSFREILKDRFTLDRPVVASEILSLDKTHKIVCDFGDEKQVETVYIPDVQKEDSRITRGTVCLSSQVGCTLTCRFCHTGTQRFVGNLTCQEIVGQFLLMRDLYCEWPSPSLGVRQLSNIVMMGMGEPLYNYDAVVEALKIFVDGEGIAISKRRITLSTAGVVPGIHRLSKDIDVNLAVSLHAPDDDLRTAMMPINKKYPLKDLMEACRHYHGSNNQRRITFEYVMLKDVNDSLVHAKALVKLVHGIPCKFNLLPFNDWPTAMYECSTEEKIHEFGQYLASSGHTVTLRRPRGRDILAACGQLKSQSSHLKKKNIA